jgi:hypothetical protein
VKGERSVLRRKVRNRECEALQLDGPYKRGTRNSERGMGNLTNGERGMRNGESGKR